MRCRKVLHNSQLIPILSWFLLRGRCAFCRAPIHWQYPAVEAVGALIAVSSLLNAVQPSGAVAWGTAIFAAAFAFILLVIAAFDLRWQLVPVSTAIGAGVVLALGRIAMGGMDMILPTIMGAITGAGILFLFVWGSRGRAMGEGDPAVGFLIGAALGWPLAPVALGLAFICGGAVAAVLLLLGRVTRKTTVPFVPFLAVGALVAYWGQGFLLQFISYAFL